MKVRLFCKEEEYQDNIKKILNGELEISEKEYDYYIIQKGFSIDSIIGKVNEEYTILKPNKIIYIESNNSEIFCITQNNRYIIREKLYEIESLFFNDGFIRINKSCVVNINYIKSIKPTFNMKFVIKMKNDDKLEISRTYYYKFKEYIGL